MVMLGTKPTVGRPTRPTTRSAARAKKPLLRYLEIVLSKAIKSFLIQLDIVTLSAKYISTTNTFETEMKIVLTDLQT